ncbi:MAG: tyrosine-type recombinase/integrase, partial [Lachnospiraceae bacterium]|nr:tyrosine-type recombinase/integrase [Lachnospiraceae bacterium]
DTYRTGYLSIKCKNALVKYLAGRTSGYVFIPKRGGVKLTKSTLEKDAKEIGKRAKAHLSTTVHVYRKTFASVTYLKTKDIKLVSKLLGHANTAVTEKYYIIDDEFQIQNEMHLYAA